VGGGAPGAPPGYARRSLEDPCADGRRGRLRPANGGFRRLRPSAHARAPCWHAKAGAEAGGGPPEGAGPGPAPAGRPTSHLRPPLGLRPGMHAGPSKTRARMGGETDFAPQTGVFAGSDHPRTRNEGAVMQRWAQGRSQRAR
jgi:hypothetical protein